MIFYYTVGFLKIWTNFENLNNDMILDDDDDDDDADDDGDGEDGDGDGG